MTEPAPATMNTKVTFGVLLNNKIIRISVDPGDLLVDVFKNLRKNFEYGIPRNVPYGAFAFYRMTNPVLFRWNGTRSTEEFRREINKACSEEENRQTLDPETAGVQTLGNELSRNHIYLVIEPPDALEESREAVSALRDNYDSLFKCLQITVQNLNKWSKDDVTNNLHGGVFTQGDHDHFRDIIDALRAVRTYTTAKGCKRDLEHAQKWKAEFKRYFKYDRNNPTVTNNREFVSFYTLLSSFDEDVPAIRASTSLYLKASSFTVIFAQPVFLDKSRVFQYHPEKSWEFPIFLADTESGGAWRKYTPRSDWMVTSNNFGVPFIISEVVSQKSQSDRHRMLLQAIAVARAGRYLLESTSEQRFFVVAICIDNFMLASRYIVMQTDPGDEEQRPVSIHQEDFNLTNKERQLDFLREMYNLTTQITELSSHLDNNKRGHLISLRNDAKKILSLTSVRRKTRTTATAQMETNQEEHEGEGAPPDEDDLGLFEGEDIQNVLQRMNYRIQFILWGHPDLAMVMNKQGDKGYLKFVKREREIQVLKYLSGIESPMNHTISGVQFWPVEGGTVVSMSVGGGWLTLMDCPTKHLWSVASQLFEAIAFMHEYNVAHMDLKPQNIMIPSQGGRVSIIDFSVSIRVRGPDVKYSGVVGTEHYMAPEVQKGQYKPMLADLWSCGRTLEEFCSRCNPSADRTKLLEMAGQLMNQDPEARPKMNTLLEWMVPSQRGEADVLPPTLR